MRLKIWLYIYRYTNGKGNFGNQSIRTKNSIKQ